MLSHEFLLSGIKKTPGWSLLLVGLYWRLYARGSNHGEAQPPNLGDNNHLLRNTFETHVELHTTP
jgi:hypothetical protein